MEEYERRVKAREERELAELGEEGLKKKKHEKEKAEMVGLSAVEEGLVAAVVLGMVASTQEWRGAAAFASRCERPRQPLSHSLLLMFGSGSGCKP